MANPLMGADHWSVCGVGRPLLLPLHGIDGAVVSWPVRKLNRLRLLERRKMFLLETLVDLCKLGAWPLVRKRVKDIERIQEVFGRVAERSKEKRTIDKENENV